MATTNHSIAIAMANTGASYNLSGLSGEHIIDLSLHPRIKEAGKMERDDCAKYVALNNQYIDGESMYSIPRLAFVTLYNIAKAINGTGKYLTGLKIEFGFDTTNDEFKLIFTPVRLDNGQKIVPNSEHYSYTIIGAPKSYLYNESAGVFDEIVSTATTTAAALKAALVNGYKGSVKILHSDIQGDTPSDFMQGIDVESMIFSFQEIFNVMYDNSIGINPTGNIFSGFDSSPILMYNCVRRDVLNPVCLIKHGLLLSVDEINLLGFYKAYGNLAHLCPPHCTTIEYLLD